MKIERKLKSWHDAGLIDEAAIGRILEYESENDRPIALYAIAGVGSVAIVLGLVAIIAANWAEISSATKLSLDLCLGIALAVAIARSSVGLAREILLVLYYGFVLASIGLIGQVYHLESEPWRALTAWSLLTLPFMLGVRGSFGSAVWLSGLLVTHAVGFFDLVEWLEASFDFRARADAAVILLAASPLAYLLFSRLDWTTRNRPNFASEFWYAGWAGIAGLSLAGVGSFYGNADVADLPRTGALVGLALWIAFAYALPKIDTSLSDRARLGLRSVLLGGGALSFLALVIPHASWDLAGALSQLILLTVFAWASLQAGYGTVFRICTGAVCIRLFIIYLEVFGSLLETGFGLILGGALAIALSFGWVRRTKALEARLQPPDVASDASASPTEGDRT